MQHKDAEEILMEQQTLILKAKKIECDEINATNPSGTTCEPIWDKITCWPETEPGEYQILPCAHYFFGFDPKKNATRFCFENGTWVNWTNYSQCYNGSLGVTVTEPFVGSLNDSTLVTYLPVLVDISKAGYSISLVTLIFAFFILASVRTLRCPRNILHLHLFFSFCMRAFVALLKESLFVLSVGLPSNLVVKSGVYFFNETPQETAWGCKLIFSIWQYFMLANYSWILMEALYLHNLIFNALFSDRSSVTIYVILGWGLPLLFLIPWIICRIALDDELCWTVNKIRYVYAIIYVPVAVSNLVCLILFVYLTHVIFTKLQSSMCEQMQIYRRLAKSTLTLLPLFGVHYIVFLAFEWASNIGIKTEIIILFIDQLFTSSQGFFVALLYCFLNSEVRTELNKRQIWWHRRRRNTDASDGKAFLSVSAAGSPYKRK